MDKFKDVLSYIIVGLFMLVVLWVPVSLLGTMTLIVYAGVTVGGLALAALLWALARVVSKHVR